MSFEDREKRKNLVMEMKRRNEILRNENNTEEKWIPRGDTLVKIRIRPRHDQGNTGEAQEGRRPTPVHSGTNQNAGREQHNTGPDQGNFENPGNPGNPRPRPDQENF